MVGCFGAAACQYWNFKREIYVPGWQTHFVVAGHISNIACNGFVRIFHNHPLRQDSLVFEFGEVHGEDRIMDFDYFTALLGLVHQCVIRAFLKSDRGGYRPVFAFEELGVSVPALINNACKNQVHLTIACIFGCKRPFYSVLSKKGKSKKD